MGPVPREVEPDRVSVDDVAPDQRALRVGADLDAAFRVAVDRVADDPGARHVLHVDAVVGNAARLAAVVDPVALDHRVTNLHEASEDETDTGVAARDVVAAEYDVVGVDRGAREIARVAPIEREAL